MGCDSYILGNAGPGHTIEHDGRAYHFSLIGQKQKAEWEEMLLRRAQKAAEMLAPYKPAGWFDAKLEELNNEYMAGEMSLVSERSLELIGKPGGVQMMVSILTGLDVLQLVPLLTEKREQVTALIHLIIRESFPGVKLAEADPNE